MALELYNRYKRTSSGGLEQYNRYIVNADKTLSLVNKYRVVSEVFESMRFAVEPYVASVSGTVKFTLSSRVNVTVNWGDGTSQNVSGQTSSFSHTYTNFSQGVMYNVTVTPTTIYNDSTVGRVSFNATSGLRSFYSIGRGFRLDGISFSDSTINEISDNALNDGETITTLSSLFNGCPELTSVPEVLFKYCTNVNNMYKAFSGTGITSIPETLLSYCSKLVNIGYLFESSKVTSIPANLFINNPLTEGFYYTFSNCPITSIPPTLFDAHQNATTYIGVFYNCKGIISAVPELWNKPNAIWGDRCYRGCTNASNYSSIPSGWR